MGLNMETSPDWLQGWYAAWICGQGFCASSQQKVGCLQTPQSQLTAQHDYDLFTHGQAWRCEQSQAKDMAYLEGHDSLRPFDDTLQR